MTPSLPPRNFSDDLGVVGDHPVGDRPELAGVGDLPRARVARRWRRSGRRSANASSSACFAPGARTIVPSATRRDQVGDVPRSRRWSRRSTSAPLSRPARSCVIQFADGGRRPRRAPPSPRTEPSPSRSATRTLRDVGLQPELRLVAGAAGGGQLRQAAARIPSIHASIGLERGDVGLGEVAVVERLLLRAHASWWRRRPRPSGASPARSARRRRAPSICRSISNAIARSSERTEFMFLISTFVPNASVPAGRSETFASQRSDPSSIRTSRDVERLEESRAARARYAPASSGERMSGSLTHSTSGTPARL